jgi:uncharacterized membrane protein YccF (DUF307 family)
VILLLNILWFVFGGVISGALWLLTALALAVTIVGLPWASAALRLAFFSFAPFGRTAIPRTGWHVGRGGLDIVLNLVWVVFAGWWLALHHVVIGCLQCLSIIGIPFGLQHFKLAAIALAPVGTEIVPA